MAVKGKALVQFACGARGTGKTAWMVRQCERDTRLAVWDFKHDPNLARIADTYTDLPSFIRALAAPTFRARYLVDHGRDIPAQFDLFARACWAAGCLRMFVAELPEVTKAGRAPASWRRCVNVGRDYVAAGQRKWLAIIAEAQREAEVDKSFTGNCDVIHLGRLGNVNDCKRFAAMWGLDVGELATLPDLHWIEKRADSPHLVRGVLSFGNAPAATKKKSSAARRTP